MSNYVCLGTVHDNYQERLDALKERFKPIEGTRLLVVEFDNGHCEAICEYDDTPNAEQFAEQCELSVWEDPI